jgi:hypothetical protein
MHCMDYLDFKRIKNLFLFWTFENEVFLVRVLHQNQLPWNDVEMENFLYICFWQGELGLGSIKYFPDVNE